jgi:hypothetical protein
MLYKMAVFWRGLDIPDCIEFGLWKDRQPTDIEQ